MNCSSREPRCGATGRWRITGGRIPLIAAPKYETESGVTIVAPVRERCRIPRPGVCALAWEWAESLGELEQRPIPPCGNPEDACERPWGWWRHGASNCTAYVGQCG